MSELLGQYKVSMVKPAVYQKWLEQVQMLSAGVSWEVLQHTIFNWFKEYFVRTHEGHRLLAIQNSDRIRDFRGQATFLYAHRPMTEMEQFNDEQFVMVDEDVRETMQLEDSQRQITYS